MTDRDILDQLADLGIRFGGNMSTPSVAAHACTHGEVECDPARGVIRCRKCGMSAALRAESVAAPQLLAALDDEIARRRSPDYVWFPKPNANQTPAGRAGAAGARGMQHGELTGLVIARHIVAEAAALHAPPALDAALAEDGRKWRAAEAEGHVVDFSEDGYGLRHPPSCRPGLIECRFNVWLAALELPAMPPGRYSMVWDEGSDPRYVAATPASGEPARSSEPRAWQRPIRAERGPAMGLPVDPDKRLER